MSRPSSELRAATLPPPSRGGGEDAAPMSGRQSVSFWDGGGNQESVYQSLYQAIPVSESEHYLLKSGKPVPADLHDRVLRNRTAQLTSMFQQKLQKQAQLLRQGNDERDKKHREELDSLNRAWEERYDAAVRRIAALRDNGRRATVAEGKLSQLEGALRRSEDSSDELKLRLASMMQEMHQNAIAVGRARDTEEALAAMKAQLLKVQVDMGEMERLNRRLSVRLQSLESSEAEGEEEGEQGDLSEYPSRPDSSSARSHRARSAAASSRQSARSAPLGIGVDVNTMTDVVMKHTAVQAVAPSQNMFSDAEVSQRVRAAAALAVKIEDSLQADTSCPNCLNIFDNAQLLSPCGHTLCMPCANAELGFGKKLHCGQCGDFDPRTMVPNRVVDNIAVKYAVRSSYLGELKFVLREVEKAQRLREAGLDSGVDLT